MEQCWGLCCPWLHAGVRAWGQGWGKLVWGTPTQSQGVVLPGVLMQHPQDRLLGAHGFQLRSSGHGAAEFLQLVFVSLRLLPEGFQTVLHTVLTGGFLAAEERHEACKIRWHRGLEQGRLVRRVDPPRIPITAACHSASSPASSSVVFQRPLIQAVLLFSL